MIVARFPSLSDVTLQCEAQEKTHYFVFTREVNFYSSGVESQDCGCMDDTEDTSCEPNTTINGLGHLVHTKLPTEAPTTGLRSARLTEDTTFK